LSDDGRVVVRAATAQRWDDVVTVMGVRGDPSRCWCQYYRLRGRDWQTASQATNRQRLREQVHEADRAPGVLAYLDGQPVGWCAVGAKDSYPRLVASPITGPSGEGVWSVSCFVVRVGWRRQGVAQALLDGAVDFARSAGASIVEGYPVDADAASNVTSGELHHGTLSLFRGVGFTEVARPSQARAVVQLRLS